MIHVNNKSESELDPLPGKRNPAPKYAEHREALHITEEEFKVYKKCSNESFIKTGIPFAIFFDVFRNVMKKKTGEVGAIEPNPALPKGLNVKRGLLFFGNVIFGSFLYTPVCYQKLREFHEANEKKRLAEQTQGPAAVEGLSAKTQPEDFSYPTDLMTNIGESESSFSADFNASKLVLEDEEKPKVPHITYDDLRSRNRELQTQGLNKPPYSNVAQDRPTPPAEPSQPPPRRVRRNKYGDEME